MSGHRVVRTEDARTVVSMIAEGAITKAEGEAILNQLAEDPPSSERNMVDEAVRLARCVLRGEMSRDEARRVLHGW